jgi:O-antigen/teichoic acid export membrane protein
VIIARSAGADVLGYYSRAYGIMLLPVSLIGDAIGRFLLPTLARQKHDLSLAMQTWKEYTMLSLFLGMPIVSLLFAGSEQVVLVLLGSQWGAAAPFLQILAMSIAAQLVIRPLGYGFQALGRTRAQLFIGVVTTTITAVMLLVGNSIAGATGVAIGFTSAYTLHLVAYLTYAHKRLQLRLVSVVPPAARLLLVSAVATVGGVVVREGTNGLPLLGQMAVIALAVTVLYVLAAYILTRRTLFAAWGLLRGQELTS